MSTLQQFRTQRHLTNADLAHALGCDVGTAIMIIQGLYVKNYDATQMERLAEILGVTPEQCAEAMQESYEHIMAGVRARREAKD